MVVRAAVTSICSPVDLDGVFVDGCGDHLVSVGAADLEALAGDHDAAACCAGRGKNRAAMLPLYAMGCASWMGPGSFSFVFGGSNIWIGVRLLMIRKVIAASALSLGLVGGAGLVSGVASAGPINHFIGTYPDEATCVRAGINGMHAGWFEEWKCDGASLWVSYPG